MENNQVIKERDLYKVITIYGKTFELYYGYYEEKDRYSKYNEPRINDNLKEISLFVGFKYSINNFIRPIIIIFFIFYKNIST